MADSPESSDGTADATESSNGEPETVDRDAAAAAETGDTPAGSTTDEAVAERSTEDLRAEVESRYDFEDFDPEAMAEMTVEEWEAVFDHESWLTGTELLDRVERELRASVRDREVFAVVERVGEGDDDRVVAYSDEGYVVVRPDGTVQGTGTVLRDVEPMVALCSIEDYEVPDVDDDAGLPHPDTVAAGSGDFGNRMLQVVAGATLLAGVSFLVVWVASVLGAVEIGFAGAIVVTLGLLFVAVGGFLFLTVANARLSDRRRAEQYRDRLRAVGAGREERPDFLPEEAFEAGGRRLEEAMARVHEEALEEAGTEAELPGGDR
jgi:hypothetical protein